MTPDINGPRILDPSGQPARAAHTTACPQCGAGTTSRRPSSGFGTPHPICGVCGYAWTDEPWRPAERQR